MSKEQIEEMAHDLCHWWNGTGCTFGMVGKKAFACRFDCNAFIDAERLYNAGYRKQEWISVDERLPDKSDFYLVNTISHFGTDFVTMTPYTFYGGWGNLDVTHWMPLPEPPKMKGGEEE